MKVRARRSTLLLAAASVVTGRAQKPGAARPVLTEEPRYQAICLATLAQPLPVDAAALAAEGARVAAQGLGCDEQQAYYGFGKPPDYRGALRCAYRHRLEQGTAAGSFAGGPGTLAMLYANGYGVPRNYELAIRFTCELGGGNASEETELRVGRLEALRDGKLSRTQPFDLCDDAVSGAMGSYCESITQKLADVGRARRLGALRGRLPQAAQALFPQLQAAESDFEKARGDGEDTGGGGTGSAGFVELDQGQLREQFVMNMRRFAAHDLPRAGADDRARAAQQMQTAARAVQSFNPDPHAGSRQPTPQSLAATQQAWQALFAAWMRFVPVAYPQLSQNAVATELLRLRIHQLKHLGL